MRARTELSGKAHPRHRRLSARRRHRHRRAHDRAEVPESQGQTWVIDSRAGAQGIIGAEIAAKSPPDGYTLLMYTTNFTIHPSIYKSLPYDFSRR